MDNKLYTFAVAANMMSIDDIESAKKYLSHHYLRRTIAK
jgi:hypothetical protein